MTTTSNIHMGAGAPEPSEVPGSGDRGVAQVSLGGERRFRVEREDRSFIRWGIMRYYGHFVEGDEDVPREYQLIAVDKLNPRTGKPMRMTLVKSTRFDFIPNEVALKISDEVAGEFGLRPLGEPEYTSSGLGVYRRYIGDREEAVVPGDLVSLGFQMKNSIDGSMGHTYTGFTLRLICKNGAVAPSDATSFRVAGGSYEDIREEVRGQLGSILEGLGEELEIYREWTRITANVRLASLLAAALPKKMLPFVEFAPKTKAVVGIKPITAWEAYNTVTDFLTHQKIEARHRDWLRMRLRRAMSVWQAVEAGQISEDEAMERLGAAEG